jgi:putative nucleotidyltransferase with HDIG domain
MRVLSAADLDFEHGLVTPSTPAAPPATSGDADLLAAVRTAAAGASSRLAHRRKLLEALVVEGGDPQELTALIQSDPGLSQGVLARINGPEYALDKPIDQLSRAAVFLGHAEIRLQAWRLCLSEGIQPSSSMTAGAFERHWQHTFTVARTAQALGVTFGSPRPDILVTAGLLHDIGKLLALAQWPDRARAYDNVRFSNHQAHAAELARLGTSHAHLSALLCDALGLPPDVRRIVEDHHAPSYGPPARADSDDVAVAVVHLADVLCHLSMRHLGKSAGHEIYRPAAGWLELLKLRRIEDLLAQNVVLALLDPALVWRGVPGERRAA